MRTILVTILSMVSWVVYPQQQQAIQPNMEQEQVKLPDDGEVYRLINEANELATDQPSKALRKIERALELSIDLKNKRAEAYCYNTLGGINYQLSQFSSSVNYYNRALRIFRNIDEEKGIYNVLRYIGSAYEGMDSMDKAIEHYREFLRMAGTRSQEDEMNALRNIGRINYSNEEYDAALEVYRTALQKAETMGDEALMAEINGYIGIVQDAKGAEDEALQTLQQSNEMALNTSNVDVANQTYSNMGNYYQQRGQRKEELEVQQQAMDFNKEKSNPSGMRDNAQRIGEIYLEENEPEQAIEYLKQSVDLSMELGQLDKLSESNRVLSEAYEKAGDYVNALKEYENYKRITDSIEQVRARETLMALKLSNELQQKVQHIEVLEAEKQQDEAQIRSLERDRAESREFARRQRVITWSLVAILLVVGVSTYLIYRSSREKRRANQLLALKSLRSQMNPHFIFNSLNSVNNFIARSDERSANKYLSEFARLMRSVLENSKHDFIPLSEEISMLRRYLELEHLRFKDKFDYSFSVDDEVDAENVDVPPMLIQPFIENAIWHGIRYKEEKGFLKVRFEKAGGVITCEIEDNGIGRERSAALKTANQKEGRSTGMKNIEERLEILNRLHKTNLKVKVEDLKEATGTKVTVSIPYKTSKEAA